ncbi:MAG: hypothetical protein LC130_08890 [Bryobacterales bacterium]|nr:hypothetical protein [Bryobacterales bacterium]
MEYDSYVEVTSQAADGVTFVLSKMSFGRRIELTKRIRELAQKLECLHAGEDPDGKIQSALLSAEIERTYVLWGVKEVRGLIVDGRPASPESLIDAGPEDVFREAAAAVRTQCGLTEAERKNS